jgi:hypothetical protein
MISIHVMRFMTAQRTLQDLRTLRCRMDGRACRCSQGPPLLLAVSPNDHSRPGGSTSEDLSNIIFTLSAILDRNTTQGSSIQRLLKSDGGLHCVLPEGSHVGILPMLASWIPMMAQDVSGYTAGLTAAHANLSQMIGHNSLLGLVTSPFVIDRFHTEMARCTRVIQQASIETLDDAVKELSGAYHAGTLLIDVLFPAEFILWMSLTSSLTMRDLLVDVCHVFKAVELFPLRRGCQIQANLFNMAMRMWEAVRSDGPLDPALHGEFFKAVLDVAESESTPAQDLVATILRPQWRRRCRGPTCLASYTRAAQFKVCGGCRTAAYCSRKCQILAWNHRSASHRAVCKILAHYHWAMRTDEQPQMQHVFDSLPVAMLETARANLDALRASQLAHLGRHNLAWIVHDV